MPMIRGESVTVELRRFGEVDAYGNATESYAPPVTVDDVLIGDGGVVQRVEDGEPHALRYDRTFHFPRGWASDLRGAHVTHGGHTYEVVDAVGYTDANMPPGIRWNMVAKAVRFDG
jgi:hypothetical protein